MQKYVWQVSCYDGIDEDGDIRAKRIFVVADSITSALAWATSDPTVRVLAIRCELEATPVAVI